MEKNGADWTIANVIIVGLCNHKPLLTSLGHRSYQGILLMFRSDKQ